MTRVTAYDPNTGIPIASFNSIQEAAKAFNTHQPNISRALNRRCGTAGGVIWCSEDDIEPEIYRNRPTFKQLALTKIRRTDLKTRERVEFSNAVEAEFYTDGATAERIIACCLGYLKSINRYSFNFL